MVHSIHYTVYSVSQENPDSTMHESPDSHGKHCIVDMLKITVLSSTP